MAELKNKAKRPTRGGAPGSDKGAANSKFKRPKKKVCQFCADKIKTIDYKDAGKLSKYITEKGKMVSRRQTGTCARHQRELSTCIKRARMMALMPYVGDLGKAKR